MKAPCFWRSFRPSVAWCFGVLEASSWTRIISYIRLYIHAYIHTYLHTYIHTYIHMFILSIYIYIPKNHWHLVLRYPYLWVRGRYLEPLREGSGPSGNIGRGTEVPKTDKNWLTINLFIRVQNMLNMINGHARHKLHKFDIFCAFSSCYVFLQCSQEPPVHHRNCQERFFVWNV